VGSEYDPNAETEGEAEQPKAKGVGGRLRAAAERFRGGKKAEGGEEAEGGEKKAKPARAARDKASKVDTRGKAAKTTTPRKAGGA
jgi:hypothetical protein